MYVQEPRLASIKDLLKMAVEIDVILFPCGMTIEVFGYKHDEFIDGIQPLCGAAAFAEYASDADVSLFISRSRWEGMAPCR